jgi:hypothetical protein
MFFAKVRSGWALLAALAGACGSPGALGGAPAAAPAPRATSAPPSGGGAAAPARQRVPARLEKTYTGRGAPNLVVRNRFPTVQFVFLDWKAVGRVGPGASVAFELSSGTHTVTSADSSDPDDNPVSITEAFELGFSYSYEIAPE